DDAGNCRLGTGGAALHWNFQRCAAPPCILTGTTRHPGECRDLMAYQPNHYRRMPGFFYSPVHLVHLNYFPASKDIPSLYPEKMRDA
ncbi:MAG: hypothetical protein U9R60_18900, partial [Bacteroidota bacterium]|nr:hypothetical protein [Bacteroidota bacterium]